MTEIQYRKLHLFNQIDSVDGFSYSHINSISPTDPCRKRIDFPSCIVIKLWTGTKRHHGMYPGVFSTAMECNSMDNFFVQSYTNVYVRGNSVFTLWKSSKSFHISSDQCFISALSNVDRTPSDTWMSRFA